MTEPFCDSEDGGALVFYGDNIVTGIIIANTDIYCVVLPWSVLSDDLGLTSDITYTDEYNTPKSARNDGNNYHGDRISMEEYIYWV